MAIEAVLFDLGDTLWHFPSMPPVDVIRGETVRRISELLRSWGIDPTVEERRFIGRDIRLAVTAADAGAFAGDRVSPDFVGITREVLRRHGLDLSRERAAEVWDMWNLGGPFFGRRLFDDALPTLEWLRSQGYRLGCVTNRMYGGPRFRQELVDCGLADYFETLAVSCDEGYLKPHPKLFERALRDLGLPPEACAMVGDNPVADVGGANALGMTSIQRVHPGHEVDPGAPELPPGWQTPGGDGADPADPLTKPDYVIGAIAELRELPPFAA